MLNQQEAEIYHMLTVLIRSLVDQPDDVIIEALQGDSTLTFHVQTNPADTGKLIGANGRMARALRIILGANAVKVKRTLNLDIRTVPA